MGAIWHIYGWVHMKTNLSKDNQTSQPWQTSQPTGGTGYMSGFLSGFLHRTEQVLLVFLNYFIFLDIGSVGPPVSGFSFFIKFCFLGLWVLSCFSAHAVFSGWLVSLWIGSLSFSLSLFLFLSAIHFRLWNNRTGFA